MIRKERNIRVLTSSVWGVNFNLISYQYVSSRGAVEHRSKVRRVGFEHGGNNEGKTKLRGLKCSPDFGFGTQRARHLRANMYFFQFITKSIILFVLEGRGFFQRCKWQKGKALALFLD